MQSRSFRGGGHAASESCKAREDNRPICWRRHSAVNLIVKTIGIFGAVMTASIALLQPAQGRSQASGHFSPTHHFSGSTGHYYGGPRSYSAGGARYYHPSPRSYSQGAYRNRVYSRSGPRYAVNRTAALNPRAYPASNPRLSANRRATLRTQGFDNQGRVLARSSQGWNRTHDHFWHGHRCHWHNNAWVIIDPWFWGFGYGYYPYGAFSYDDGYYDDGYVPAEYAQPEYDNGNPNSSVSQVQAVLARRGYYHGAIDGSMGPATRSALRQYQQNHGLPVTGRIDWPVLEALRLR